MTIVCATHFTDSSLAAIKVAAQLARTHRERLCVLNVVPPAQSSSGSEKDVEISAVNGTISQLASEGIVINTTTVCGPLASAVRQACAVNRASLLVVGDSHQTLGPLIVGPLDRFADSIGVPSLIVRDATPFAAWSAGTGPLKVMLAMDGTWKSAAAREWIIRLSAFGPIDLVASYLWWPKDERQPRAWALVAQRLEAEAAFAGLPSNVKARIRLEVGCPKIGPQLLALAKANHADVFVLGTHPHRGPVGQQWSVSHEVLALAPMSVACIPDPVVRSTRTPSQHGFRAAS